MAEPRVTAAMCAQTRGLAEPRLSADGRTVAFVATAAGQPALVTVPVTGGPERIVTADPVPSRGGVFDWLPDGSGLVYAGRDRALWVVRASGGAPRRVAYHEAPIAAPAVSPDGTRVAYVIDQRDVAVASLLSGGPWPVRLSAGADFAADPSWSADGEFVAWHEWDVPHMPWDESRWAVAPADGSGVVATMVREGVQVQQPRFAPVGSDLAFLSDASGWLNLWVFGPERDNEHPLVDEPFEHGGPTWGNGNRTHTWSPDGRRLAFTRNEQGFGRLCVVRLADGDVGAVAKGVHSGLSWRGATLAALRSGAVTPPQLVAYDT
ncbi:MAG TPA: LpqB family beta-propeller domain-containing protein, partial [Acidimicrobiales bacterium]